MCIFTFLFSTLVADVQESFLVFFISVFLKEKTKSELMFTDRANNSYLKAYLVMEDTTFSTSVLACYLPVP